MNPDGITKKMDSEVHIVHIDDNDQETIYLLNPDIDSGVLPDIFLSKNETFTYLPKKYLKIEGYSPLYGNYVASIYPEKMLTLSQVIQKAKVT